jgi:hypothetical protein
MWRRKHFGKIWERREKGDAEGSSSEAKRGT